MSRKKNTSCVPRGPLACRLRKVEAVARRRDHTLLRCSCRCPSHGPRDHQRTGADGAELSKRSDGAGRRELAGSTEKGQQPASLNTLCPPFHSALHIRHEFALVIFEGGSLKGAVVSAHHEDLASAGRAQRLPFPLMTQSPEEALAREDCNCFICLEIADRIEAVPIHLDIYTVVYFCSSLLNRDL